MNRAIRRTAGIFGSVLLLAVVIGVSTSIYVEMKIGHSTARTVCHILNSTFSSDDTMIDTERELDRLVFQRTTPESDEAAVILLDYYMGEHNGEELFISLTKRGTRVLPYLIKYRDHPAPVIRPWFWGMKRPGLSSKRAAKCMTLSRAIASAWSRAFLT